MKKKTIARTTFAAFLACAAAEPAGALQESDFRLETTQQLAALCAAPDNASAIHMCQGYFVGAHHTYTSINAALGEHLYCPPTDVTRDWVAREFSRWVAATPTVRSMPAIDGVFEWARRAFPCPMTGARR
jgi:hypothetical protein